MKNYKMQQLIALKTETDKLDIKKFANVQSMLNNLLTKVDDLDVDKLETVPADLKNEWYSE